MVARSLQTSSSSPFSVSGSRLLTWVAASAFTIAFVLCGLLLVRRLSGDLTEPLNPTALIVLAIASATAATVFRLFQPTGSALVRLLLPTMGIGFVIGGVLFPDTPLFATLAVCAIVGIEEVAWWSREVMSFRRDTRRASRDESSAADERVTPGKLPVEAYDPDAPLPADTTQQITRAHDEVGNEFLYGRVRSDFAAGERSQNVHLAFCPPLEAKPIVAVEQTDGPYVTVKVAQAETFGTRLELRLATFAEHPESVVLQFEVRTSESTE